MSQDKFPSEKIKEKVNVGPDSTEEDLWSGTFSMRAMTGTWILLLLATVGLLFLMFLTSLRTSSTAWWVVLIAIAVGWIGVLGYGWYRKISVRYELTSQRLRHREGFIVRKADRIELIDIADVTYRQGPIQAILGVGNILITSSDKTHPNLWLKGIADVRKISELIDDARLQERRRRRLHIEAS